jgi:hypothetical protein
MEYMNIVKKKRMKVRMKMKRWSAPKKRVRSRER